MRYLRLSNCLVYGRECYFKNILDEYEVVANKPLNANDGDTFGVVEITSEGVVSGIVYLPEDRLPAISRKCRDNIVCLPDFEAAWSEAMQIMPLAAAVATPMTLDKKVGVIFDRPTMRDAVNFAMENGIFAEMAQDMDKALDASQAHAKWIPMFKKIAELLLLRRETLQYKPQDKPIKYKVGRETKIKRLQDIKRPQM